ncbi:hypothetical protein EDC96DRAFT_26519 [Choanephora cucurbitarum]|nr:hypothetical protein EDC96DRAFT_26519 [Choanephora cucurbitarum]
MIIHEKEITLKGCESKKKRITPISKFWLKEKMRVLLSLFFLSFLFSLVSFKLQSHLYFETSTAAKSSFALYSFLHLSWCSLIICVFLFSQTSCQISPLLSTMLSFGMIIIFPLSAPF